MGREGEGLEVWRGLGAGGGGGRAAMGNRELRVRGSCKEKRGRGGLVSVGLYVPLRQLSGCKLWHLSDPAEP